MKPLTRQQRAAIRAARAAQDRLERTTARMEMARSDLHGLIAEAHATGLSTYCLAEELEYYSQARIAQVVREHRA